MGVMRFPNRRREHVPPPGGCSCPPDDVPTAPSPWHDGIMAAQAAGARMALAPQRRPYIARGLTQQGRQPDACRALTHEELRHYPWGDCSRPGPLSEAELVAHIDETRAAHLWAACNPPAPAIFGPYRHRRQGPSRLRLALRRAWRWLLAPRCAL